MILRRRQTRHCLLFRLDDGSIMNKLLALLAILLADEDANSLFG